MRDEQEERKAKAEREADGADVSTSTAAKSAGQNRERRDVGKAEGGGPNTARSGAPMSRKRSAPGGVVSENEAPSATRSYGGRNFQRQGGAWVDTAYNSSRPTTNVRRGSEQYRTLVADEPGLRAIAEELSGEVIVVWKTRAYRFY
jgi:hypothetical protein